MYNYQIDPNKILHSNGMVVVHLFTQINSGYNSNISMTKNDQSTRIVCFSGDRESTIKENIDLLNS